MSDFDDIDRRLSLAKAGLSSSPSTRERVLAELTRRFPELAQAAPATPEAQASPLSPAASTYGPRRGGGFWQALRLTGVRGAGLGALLVGSGFMAGYAARSSSLSGDSLAPSSSPSLRDGAAFAPQPAGAALPEPPSEVARDSSRDTISPVRAPAETPEPRARTASPPHRAALEAAATAHPELDLERELAVLRRAERALRKGNPALALALLDELESENPSPTLREERTATRLLASCQSLAPGAELAAQRFLEQHPESVYAARLESACRAPSSASSSEPVVPATDAAEGGSRSDGSRRDGH